MHSQPELSWQETGTTDFIREKLGQIGLSLNRGPRGVGGFVDIKSAGVTGGQIALRGDIDAIPVTEETGLDFSSLVPGVMHACGHDVHTTVVLGVCDALRHILANESSNVLINMRAIFQPAEEVAQGAYEMIELGALENVERIIAMHVDSSRQVGTIALKNGKQTACCDEIHVRFTGEGGHGARPHETTDPIFAAAQFINLAYSSITRKTDPRNSVVLSFCQISGGKSANVIPTSVSIKGTLRSYEEDVRQSLFQQLKDHAESITRSVGVKTEVEIGVGIPSVNNCPATNELIRSAAESFLPVEAIEEVDASFGGEDFACYQKELPGSLVRIGSAKGDYGTAHLHSPHFDVDESVIRIAVQVFTRSILQSAQFGD